MSQKPEGLFSSESEITYIYDGFKDHSLPVSDFTHAAHWAVTVWLLSRFDGADVARRLPQMIRSFNIAKGGQNTVSEGYHETITLASIGAAAHMRSTAGPALENWEITNQILTSRLGKADWILHHWSKQCLFSPKARAGWVTPDMQALPFGIYHPVAKAA